VLDSRLPPGHCDLVALTPENLDKVMTELLAVSRSAMSKREEAVNLARIWGRLEDAPLGGQRRITAEAGSPVTAAQATQGPGDAFRVAPPTVPARRRGRWRRVA
jgi:hypothetical protein